MRHRVARKILGRDSAHRASLLKNLATSLVVAGKIETTLAKAKFVKPYVEKLVTKAKAGANFNNVKYLKTKLTTDEAVRAILEKVAPEFADRNGGYTRIVRTRNRDGDNSTMARLEFVTKVKAQAATTEKATEAKAAKKSVRAAKVTSADKPARKPRAAKAETKTETVEESK